MKIFLPPACACAFTVFALKYLPLPYVWTALFWAVAFLVAMLSTRHAVGRAAFLNAAVLVMTLGMFEVYAYLHPNPVEKMVRTYTMGYRVPHDVLGIAPPKGITAESKLTYEEEVVYDVVYSIGPNGLRISAPGIGSNPSGNVLFFGCSFTFGEGLNDNETLPYRVGVLTQGDFLTYNFGFHGYGPHQMLAALEHGLVQQATERRPTHVIYQALPDHVSRAAGLYSWGRHGPRYRVTSDGSVKNDGHFDDDDRDQTPTEKILRYQLQKSFLMRWLSARRRPIHDEDIRLFVGIVSETKRLVQKQFPGCEFHVLLWRWHTDAEVEEYDRIYRALKSVGLQIHLVADILTDYISKPSQYWISPYDQHPNGKANETIARYVAEKILK